MASFFSLVFLSCWNTAQPKSLNVYLFNVGLNCFTSLILRAKKYGWQDTYVFTKAMGEMMIDKMRGETPVVIIRPSVIESTCKEPFPGWMEGNR